MELHEHINMDGTLSEQAEDEIRVGIRNLATAVSNTAHAHGWWSDDDGNKVERNMGEMIALMHSELSEALESYRDNEPMLWYKHEGFVQQDAAVSSTAVMNQKPGKPEGIASEFADCIIRILDTCQTLNIPVAQALLDKHNYNLTRPYRHGGKLC